MAENESITRTVQRYIFRNSSVRHCLQRDLINLSALSRKICEEMELDKFDAVLKACKRYQLRASQKSGSHKEVAKLIENARVQVRTKIVVATISKPRTLEKVDALQTEIRKEKGDFNMIEGLDVITIITNRRFIPLLKKTLRQQILRLSEDLVQVCMIMDASIEKTTGVVAYVYGILSESGVNIREEMSCWSDIMFIIEEQDLPKAMEVLNY